MNFVLIFFSGGFDTLDTILDMTKKILSSVYFCLLPTDVAQDNVFLFCSCRVIALEYIFGKIVPVTAIMDAFSLWFIAMDNVQLHAYGISPEDKIEERITLVLCHEHLYLAGSDDEWYNKSTAADTFDISCGGEGSRFSLSAITVSVFASSNVVGFWMP